MRVQADVRYRAFVGTWSGDIDDDFEAVIDELRHSAIQGKASRQKKAVGPAIRIA